LGGFFIVYHKYIYIFLELIMSIRFSTISNSATVQLATSVNPVNEGSSSVVTLTTTGIQNGQNIPYTISGVGITSDDIGEALTGNFVVHGGTATKTLNIAADLTTEGQETLTLSLGSQFNSTNVSLTVNDTSLTPVSGDMYYDNVVLLMNMDGTVGTSTFVDAKGHTMTPVGSVIHSATRVAHGTTSAYFDGSGDYIYSTHNDFSLGAGNFTIECFVYPTSYNPSYCAIIETRNAHNSASGLSIQMKPDGIISPVSDGTWVNSNTALALDTWSHLAIVRNGTTLTVYINGVYTGAVTCTRDFTDNSLKIGMGTWANSYFFGYIDDLRITKGVARYTSNFTVPDAAFSDLKNENVDPFFNNVALLMHMEGGTWTDTTGSSTITSHGSTLSTSTAKFGLQSASATGPSTYVTAANATGYNFGTGDYTIEFWFYNNAPASGTSTSIFCFALNNDFRGGHSIGATIRAADQVLMFGWLSNQNASTYVVPTGQWIHIATSRNGSAVRGFVNGVQVYTFTDTQTYNYNRCTLGGYWSAGRGLPSGCYIDDFRVTKGVARYITNFTPPSRAFADNA